MTPESVVRVLPDEPALDKEFDYLVPGSMAGSVDVGTIVRAPLHGRRVGAWVVARDVEPPPGVELRPLAKVTGWGPMPDTLELAEWAAWRWAGRRASFLRTASPERSVRSLPGAPSAEPAGDVGGATDAASLLEGLFDGGPSVLRLPPVADRYGVVLEAVARGNALVLVPSLAAASLVARRLRRDGVGVALMPGEWAKARAGATVVGARAAAWAPVVDLAAVVIFDEHDEVWQQEQAPTWHAREVAIERARRAGVPCVMVSPCPSLEALGEGRLITPQRSAERDGWPALEVVDRRGDDPTRSASLISERLAEVLRTGARVVCVLNRKGRSRLLACVACSELARCERCEAAVVQEVDGFLTCPRCAAERPLVCLSCGAGRFKLLRPGVSRLRDELAALTRSEVIEVTAETAGADLPAGPLYVGTEAVLHQVPPGGADVVAFLDFDQELLAPRYRAADEAMALLVRAARLVGGRGSGRLLLQTRIPGHEVVQAALHADPARLAEVEMARRRALRYPPVTALAVVSGASAPAFVEGLGSPLGVEVMGPSDGHWLLRADSHRPLLDALASTPRPPGRLRVEVDPLRL